MAYSLIILWLSVLSYLYADLLEPLEKKTVVNAADCTKLTVEQCALAYRCMVVGSACVADPCIETTLTDIDICNKGTDCVKYNDAVKSYCVSSSRKGTIDYDCGFEWGEEKYLEEAACRLMSGCGTVTPLEFTGNTYYVCNKAPVPSDPCNKLTEEICLYVGQCMWEGGQCVADGCWEKTYTSGDSCKSGCIPKLITNTGATPELGYCKNGTHDLKSKCNAGTGTNFVTKKFACTGYPDPCTKIVTINNYEGGTLYVCNDVELELTVPDGAVSLRISALTALFIIILSAFSL